MNMPLERTGVSPASTSRAFDQRRLETYLSRAINGFRGPMGLRELPSANNNPAYLLITPEQQYVMRHAPQGDQAAGQQALEQEFRILAALANRDFPAPRPLLYCEEPQVIGVSFYIMTYINGRTFTDPTLPTLQREERTAIYDSINATLAQLHSYDPSALGLSRLGKTHGAIARHIQRWSESYVANRNSDIPEMNQLMAWLPENLPPERPPRLVHGDFRLEKLVFHPTEPRVIGVIDWELASLGDAVADAVYHFLAWIMPPSEMNAGSGSLAGHDLRALGIPDLEAYAAAYAKRTKMDGIPNMELYFAYSLFRVAAILQSLAAQAARQQPDSPHAKMIMAQVRPLAVLGWHFAQEAEG